VFWQRAIRSWVKDRVRWLAELPPEFESFALMKTIGSLGETELSVCWRSDLAKSKGAAAETRSRLAPVILQRGVDEALAKATTVDQARELIGWMDQAAQKEVTAYAPLDLKQKLSSRLVARADELISKPIAERESKIAALGQGKDAVLAGNDLYHDLEKRFSFAEERPAFQHALQLLQARRDADLAAGKARLQRT
jgi:hypothetical protein